MLFLVKEQIRRLQQNGTATLQCRPYGEGELVLGLNSLFSLPSDERNRWEGTTHPVADAEVILGGARAVTDASGRATIDLSTLCDGEHALSVTVLEESWRGSTRAGPALGAGISDDAMPERMYRPIAGTLVLLDKVVVREESSFAPGTDHARLYGGADAQVIDGADVVIDWRPDFVKCHPLQREPRDPSTPANLVVLHRTSGRTEIGPTLNTFTRNPDRTGDGDAFDDGDADVVSAHYVIDRDGFAVKMVQETGVSYHAGYSYWAGEYDLNQTSVGMEIVAAGNSRATDVDASERYTTEQLDAIARIYRELRASSSASLTSAHRLVGHADINVQRGDYYALRGDREACPGTTVDWPYLADNGAGTGSSIQDGMEDEIDQRVAEKYHGFFDEEGARLQHTDHDDPASPVYHGRARTDLAGANLIATLRRDLLRVGYSVDPAYSPPGQSGAGHFRGQEIAGPYRPGTEEAVDMFQRHFMRRAGDTTRFYFTKDVALTLEAVLIRLGY